MPVPAAPVPADPWTLRLSLCEYNTMEEVDYILEQMPGIVRTLRQMSPVWLHMLEHMDDPYQ